MYSVFSSMEILKTSNLLHSLLNYINNSNQYSTSINSAYIKIIFEMLIEKKNEKAILTQIEKAILT